MQRHSSFCIATQRSLEEGPRSIRVFPQSFTEQLRATTLEVVLCARTHVSVQLSLPLGKIACATRLPCTATAGTSKRTSGLCAFKPMSAVKKELWTYNVSSSSCSPYSHCLCGSWHLGNERKCYTNAFITEETTQTECYRWFKLQFLIFRVNCCI